MLIAAHQHRLFLKRGRLMEDVRQYLLSVISAAIICAIAIRISAQKGMITSMVKLLAGLIMSITVISPLVKLRIDDISDYFGALEMEAGSYIDEGQESAAIERSAIITERIESYILDKATSLGMSIEVNVVLSDVDNQTPSYIYLCGEVSPYDKKQMQQFIENDLGIPEENQLWT